MMSHDHIVHCVSCSTDDTLRDCDCAGPDVTYRTCRWCIEQRAYEDTERVRNQ